MMRPLNGTNERSGFLTLVVIYFATFSGEGLLIMYLFNSIRVNGLNIGISAMFSLISYVPSLAMGGIALVLHTKYSVRSRIYLISVARALACMSLVWTSSYMNLWATLAFIAIMEVLWYGLMPCLDEIENATVHSVGAGRGEAILTVTLQAALAASLFSGGFLFDAFGAPVVLSCLAAFQLLPAVLFPRDSSILIANKPLSEEPSTGLTSTSTGQTDVRLVALLVVAGVSSTIPQLVNILFPIKIFEVTESSALAGGIDAAYNVGALLVALLGMGAALHRASARTTSVVTMILATGSLVAFAVSSSPSLLMSAYLLLGFTTTLCRVRIRAEMFSRLKGTGASPWYSRMTNITLACCATGTLLIGVVGLVAGLWSYLIIVIVAVGGAAAGMFIKSGTPHLTGTHS